jgi:sugar-specific transcriptional regulator TrmB
MDNISSHLITALSQMGLPHLDAKVFSALCFLGTSGAKELINFVQISKPSVYECLQRLEDRGMIVKNDSKPAKFSPVSPRIAIDILIRENTHSSEIALMELTNLVSARKTQDDDDAIWTVFGPKNIDHKIREMIMSAEKSVDCVMGEKYLPLFENLQIHAAVSLHIISDKEEIVQTTKQILKDVKASVTLIPLQKIESFGLSPKKNLPKPAFFDVRNSFEIVTDNQETLSIPPIQMTKTTGLYSTNEVLVCIAYDRMQSIIRHILSDDPGE